MYACSFDTHSFSFCRKDLKLSRDIESLMTKDEKSGASEAGHDANAIEDRPAQQFSLGSWIGSTTMPGTSRSTQRRRKPVAKPVDVECQRRQQHQAVRVMQPGYLLHLHRAKNISEDMSSRPLVLLQSLASCYTVCPSSVH